MLGSSGRRHGCRFLYIVTSYAIRRTTSAGDRVPPFIHDGDCKAGLVVFTRCSEQAPNAGSHVLEVANVCLFGLQHHVVGSSPRLAGVSGEDCHFANSLPLHEDEFPGLRLPLQTGGKPCGEATVRCCREHQGHRAVEEVHVQILYLEGVGG